MLLIQDDPAAVGVHLQHLRAGRERFTIGIDGLPGAGKSHLSRDLAATLSATHLNLDDFLVKYQGSYVEHLDSALLHEQVADGLKQHAIVIVDGVCLLKVVQRAAIKLDAVIFVDLLPAEGKLGHEDVLHAPREKVLRARLEMARCLNTEVPPFWLETFNYIHEYRPHESADILYQRVERHKWAD